MHCLTTPYKKKCQLLCHHRKSTCHECAVPLCISTKATSYFFLELEEDVSPEFPFEGFDVEGFDVEGFDVEGFDVDVQDDELPEGFGVSAGALGADFKPAKFFE
eukprot:gb/GEZJ01005493.1/.p3 GENE.gb/GEZJ01005493.1/~~gb/GEZJ01005493.1/.p3  ORF type:complete len:104 (+),score=15.51 gb/GEZJ01005493.1/:601-912(+)